MLTSGNGLTRSNHGIAKSPLASTVAAGVPLWPLGGGATEEPAEVAAAADGPTGGGREEVLVATAGASLATLGSGNIPMVSWAGAVPKLSAHGGAGDAVAEPRETPRDDGKDRLVCGPGPP
mmetsp:Transcript_141489/g.368646  ORF Transcript_141489/g.368646 Transcript_141489/m.368646 type:complete len:121 (+) Transcript_141489:650-1012(+)